MRPQNFKLIRDFILPNLESKTYGSHLIWEEKNTGSFKISRIHQNNERFSIDCIEVYKDWSTKKKLWDTSDPRKITKAKHRLVTALRRNPAIETLKKESAYYRFRLTNGGNISSKASQTDLEPVLKSEEKNECKVPTRRFQNESKYNLCFSSICDYKDSKEPINSSYTEIVRSVSIIQHSSNSMQDFEIETDKDKMRSAEIFTDNPYCMEDNGENCSVKCCCILLMDGNFLPNQTCIWHGNFSEM